MEGDFDIFSDPRTTTWYFGLFDFDLLVCDHKQLMAELNTWTITIKRGERLIDCSKKKIKTILSSQTSLREHYPEATQV
jgi:hypothetical protein